MLIGYGRVSTDAQDIEAQTRALRAAGVERFHLDVGLSGKDRERPELRAAMAALRAGDVLMVTALDRLGRSVRDLHDIADEIAAKGATLNVGGVVYDPADPLGRLFYTLLAAFAEFERELLRARTREGMRIAREKGRLKGRAPKLTARQLSHLRELHAAGEHTIGELAEIMRVGRSTVYRALQRAE